MRAPWLFSAPVRRSRFIAPTRDLEPFNVEVALERIRPWAFDRDEDDDVLYYDLQTPLDGVPPQRLGAGRAGFYRGAYLKGIGRTPAAGNWNNRRDRYHGSGHLSARSAANERLVSALLVGLGLRSTIVAATAVLASDLKSAERRDIAKDLARSGSAEFSADRRIMAISVKPGTFGRMSNVVFALNHFSTTPRDAGQ